MASETTGVESITHNISKLTTYNVVTLNIQGSAHSWALWKGCLYSENKVLDEEAIIISLNPPPLLPSAKFDNLEIKKDGDVLLNLVAECPISSIINNDSDVIAIILSQCVRFKMVSKDFLAKIKEKCQLTPTCSPLKKKIRRSPTAKSSLSGAANSSKQLQYCSDAGKKNDDNDFETPFENAQVWERVFLPTAIICGIPEDTDQHDLEEFLNGAARQYDIVLEEEDAVKTVSLFNSEVGGHEVEFVNGTIARQMSCIDPALVFNEFELDFSQEMKVTKLNCRKQCSSSVIVSNLPQDLNQANFETFLNGMAWFYNAAFTGINAVKSIKAYNASSNTCIVKFCDSKAAYGMSIPTLVYHGMKLSLTPQMEEVESKLTSLVKVSKLPNFFYAPHFRDFLDETAARRSHIPGQPVKVVKTVNCYNSVDASCMVEFINSDVAQRMSNLRPVIYDRMSLNLTQQEQVVVVKHSPYVEISCLPGCIYEPHLANFLKDLAVMFRLVEQDIPAVKSMNYKQDLNTCRVEFSNPEIAKGLAVISPVVYCRKKIYFNVSKETVPSTTSSDPLQPTSHTEPSIINQSPVDNVVELSNAKVGRKASGKSGDSWDKQKTDIFLSVHNMYWKNKTPKESLWDVIGAHLWVFYDLDFSVVQLKEKLRGLKTYFTGTVMLTESGKDGSSKYTHYKAMLELHPLLKPQIQRYAREKQRKDRSFHSPLLTSSEPSGSVAPESRSSEHISDSTSTAASMDVWDKPATLLLLTEYKERQALFNSVSGSTRALDVYGLVAGAMSEQGRAFTADECKRHMEKMNLTFFTKVDLEGQTGAGSCTMDPDIFAALLGIHEGSVAMEAPVVYNVGSQNVIKRGAVAQVKVHGKPGTTGRKMAKKVWNWETDVPLTPKQHQQKMENQRMQLNNEVAKQTLTFLKNLNKSREERTQNFNTGESPN